MNDRTGSSCPLEEQAVGWALHALEPDEEMAVRIHLPQCAPCRAVVRDTEALLGGLGAALEQTDPPAHLRANLLARAAETPQFRGAALGPRRSPESDVHAARHRRGQAATPARPPVAGPPAAPSRGPGRRPSRRRIIAAALAVAGVLGFAGLGVYTAQVQQQRDENIARSETLADIITRLDQPGAQLATLAADDGTPVAAVVVADGVRTVVTAGLAPNATADSTYVLWGVGAGSPSPIGTFDVAGTGAVVHSVGSAAEGEGFGAYAISIEPGRAAPATPTTVVASGQVET